MTPTPSSPLRPQQVSPLLRLSGLLHAQSKQYVSSSLTPASGLRLLTVPPPPLAHGSSSPPRSTDFSLVTPVDDEAGHDETAIVDATGLYIGTSADGEGLELLSTYSHDSCLWRVEADHYLHHVSTTVT